MPLRFTNRVLSFADGNVEYLLGKLNGIARAFGHEMSMPQAVRTFYGVKIQTDTLPMALLPIARFAPRDGTSFLSRRM